MRLSQVEVAHVFHQKLVVQNKVLPAVAVLAHGL